MDSEDKTIVDKTINGFHSITYTLSAIDGIETIVADCDHKEEKAHLHQNRYEIVGKIGSGGMGTVWQVHDRDLQRHIAIKQVRNDHLSKEKYAQKLLKEAQLTAQLEHPNIVPIYDVELNSENQLLYTMRLVEGVSLKKVISGLCNGDKEICSTWSLMRLLRAFIDVAQGVSLAHTKGVLHRDLKPDNIMFGLFGQVLVVDWGLGIDFDKCKDQQMEVSGTLHYMSPEQIEGEKGILTPASDIYSLGIILYEIISLERPIESKEPAEIMLKTLRSDLRPLEQLVPEIPKPLQLIVDKCLQNSPANRYQNAQHLVEDIELFLDDRTLKYADVTIHQKLLGMYTKKGFNIENFVILDLKMMSWGSAFLGIFLCTLFPVLIGLGWWALGIAVVLYLRPMSVLFLPEKRHRYYWHEKNREKFTSIKT